MMLRYSPFQNQKNAFTPVPIGVFFYGFVFPACTGRPGWCVLNETPGP